MSTITTILEPQADGTVHVPVPRGMRGARVRVVATLLPELQTDEPAAPPYSTDEDMKRILAILEGGETREPDGPEIATGINNPTSIGFTADTRTFEEVFGADWNTRESNGPAMGAALEQLAQSDISTRIDLDEWVRELREDRPLAGRD
jgi:hypothetical protein